MKAPADPSPTGQWVTFTVLATAFCALGAMMATLSPKGSVWLDHVASGRLLIAGQVPENPTYPMWGYSFFAATLSEEAIWAQAVLAVAVSTWWFHLLLVARSKNGVATHAGLTIAIALAMIPWFALSTTYFSNSISIILALFAVCTLLHAELSGRWLTGAAACGLILGIAANVRSEFVVISCILALCTLVYRWRVGQTSPKQATACALALVIPTMILMMPWAWYSQSTSGEFRLKSTNSGAVAYLGLGSLPGNPWQIQPKDEFVDKLALEALGSKSAWTADADKYFSRLYGEAIRKNPGAFVQRVVNGWRVMLMQGLYFPNLRQVFFSSDQDEVLAHIAVERVKSALSLGVDLYAIDRAKKLGIELTNLQARHIAVIAVEALFRLLGVLLLVLLIAALAVRIVRYWPYAFAGWVAVAFFFVVVIVAGLIQTSPRHSTLLLPIVLGAVLLPTRGIRVASQGTT